ncbi:MAG: hypothetical protein KJ990_10265 [Proteobacteria bacterium]|nr:hypothetical protein [Pseudomonadota bacterium]MBU1648785.1 hypothetical protein [Pseudomonadota bacterium]MBU1986941.1 hypothetical protein [Pseudomonadota bacterium]
MSFVLNNRCGNVLLLAFLSLFLLASGCVSTQNGAAGSENIQVNSLTVKGKVQKFSLEEGIMLVAPPKGNRVTVKFTEQTPVKGGSLKEIVRFQPVRVIYSVEAGENRAVSIELLPQGSCGGS